ncbi:MAG: hypothetical protein JEZ07_02385 [Phycisphaerae bacterium]|nr:hypothetical protein [Phycisphaerae bacterium]
MNKFLRLIILIIIVATNTRLLAAEPEQASQEEQRLREIIREELEKLEFEKESEKADNIFSKVDIHGFISQGYIKSSDNNFLVDSKDGSLEFNEMGINFSTQISNNLRVGMQLFSRDLGDVGNNDVVLDWAYGDYRFENWLGMRIGKIKVPMGLYNETRDADMLRTSILLPQSVYNEQIRDSTASLSGVGLYGDIATEGLGLFSYQGYWGYDDSDEESGMARLILSLIPNSHITDISSNQAYCGNIMWETPAEGLRTGFSLIHLDITLDTQLDSAMPLSPVLTLPSGTNMEQELESLSLMIFSVEYTWNDLVLASEYQRMRANALLTAQMAAPAGAMTLQDYTLEREGYYLSASYRVNDWFKPGVYYSVNENPDNRTNTRDIALTTRFDLSENWTFKLEAHYMDGTEIVLTHDNPEGTDETWYVFMAKMTYSF